jgi:hypothetical protein
MTHEVHVFTCVPCRTASKVEMHKPHRPISKIVVSQFYRYDLPGSRLLMVWSKLRHHNLDCAVLSCAVEDDVCPCFT